MALGASTLRHSCAKFLYITFKQSSHTQDTSPKKKKKKKKKKEKKKKGPLFAVKIKINL